MNVTAASQATADIDALGIDIDLDVLMAGSFLGSVDVDVDALLAGSHLSTLDASVRAALEGVEVLMGVDDLIAAGRMGRLAGEGALAA